VTLDVAFAKWWKPQKGQLYARRGGAPKNSRFLAVTRAAISDKYARFV